jgi:hypothetical protein
MHAEKTGRKDDANGSINDKKKQWRIKKWND